MLRERISTTTRVLIAIMSLAGSAGASPTQEGLSGAADSMYRAARSLLNESRFDSAAGAFARIRERHAESPHVADSYYWEAFARHRLGNGEEALVLLDEQQRRHSQARTSRDAASLRARICGELAGRGDERCARELARQNRDDSGVSEETRMMAMRAVVNMRPERAMPILRRAVTNYERSPEFRTQALFMIADVAEPAEATALLVDVANNDPDGNVRQQAVFWLSEVDSDVAVDALLTILRESDDNDVLEQAVFALSQHGNPRALNAVRDLVARSDVANNVRKQAIFWLGSVGSEQDVLALRTLYLEINDRELKEQIVIAVAQAGGDVNVEWLLQLALNESEAIEVRKNAMFWFGESGASVARLVVLYDEMNDSEMRAQLIWVLAETDEDAAIAKLLDIARNDSDVELREKAIFWLGESENPRALDFLIELIDG